MWFACVMKDITISQATAHDVAAIIVLLADDPVGETREDTSEKASEIYARAFADALSDPQCTILVGRHGSEVIGCVQLNVISGLSYKGTKRALIEDMRVRADFRGQGLGRKLLDAALQQAKSSGCGLAELFAHADRLEAHKFYEACGFLGAHKGFRKVL